MDFGFISRISTVEVLDDETIFEFSDDGRTSIIRYDEDNRQLSNLIRYQSDDLEDETFETPISFMKVTDEQINQLF